jgi:hypothetical protein
VIRENENWAGIIRAVKAPIGFFALVVLCIQAILSLVALQIDRTTAMPVIYAMAGVLVLVVISVLIIAVRTSTPAASSPTTQPGDAETADPKAPSVRL